MQKQALVCWLAVLAGLLPVRSATAAVINNAALWRPRLATPAIVALDTPSNRLFTAEVSASATATNWTASAANDLTTWNCQVVSATYSTINRGTQPGWQSAGATARRYC